MTPNTSTCTNTLQCSVCVNIFKQFSMKTKYVESTVYPHKNGRVSGALSYLVYSVLIGSFSSLETGNRSIRVLPQPPQPAIVFSTGKSQARVVDSMSTCQSATTIPVTPSPRGTHMMEYTHLRLMILGTERMMAAVTDDS